MNTLYDAKTQAAVVILLHRTNGVPAMKTGAVDRVLALDEIAPALIAITTGAAGGAHAG